MNAATTLTRPIKALTEWHVEDVDGLLTLEVVKGRKNKRYHLTRLQSDWGTAFRLTAFSTDRLAGDADGYDLCLDGAKSICSCPGHQYTNSCCHVFALLSAQAQGKL